MNNENVKSPLANTANDSLKENVAKSSAASSNLQYVGVAEAREAFTMCVFNYARKLQAEEEDKEVREVSQISMANLTTAADRVQTYGAAHNDAAVYVGTYGKYNEMGGLCGMWVELNGLEDVEEFEEFCAYIHSDEEDPELMILDYENFPRDYYEESYDRDLMEKAIEWANMEEDDRDLLEAYMEARSESDATIDDAREAYVGQYDSDEEFAECLYTDLGYEVPDWLQCHIDWEGLARDLMFDYSEAKGYYFHN